MSFAGQVVEGRGGQWVVQFHEVSVTAADDGRFQATSVDEVKFIVGDNPSCQAALRMTLTGTFNGAPGWSIIFRAGDAGSGSGFDDTARVQLFDPSNTQVYNSSTSDFTAESSCVGAGRHNLDGGNLNIEL